MEEELKVVDTFEPTKKKKVEVKKRILITMKNKSTGTTYTGYLDQFYKDYNFSDYKIEKKGDVKDGWICKSYVVT